MMVVIIILLSVVLVVNVMIMFMIAALVNNTKPKTYEQMQTDALVQWEKAVKNKFAK